MISSPTPEEFNFKFSQWNGTGSTESFDITIKGKPKEQCKQLGLQFMKNHRTMDILNNKLIFHAGSGDQIEKVLDEIIRGSRT